MAEVGCRSARTGRGIRMSGERKATFHEGSEEGKYETISGSPAPRGRRNRLRCLDERGARDSARLRRDHLPVYGAGRCDRLWRRLHRARRTVVAVLLRGRRLGELELLHVATSLRPEGVAK